MLATQNAFLRNIVIAVGVGLLLYSYACYKVLKIDEAWHGIVWSWCSEDLPNLNVG